MKISNYKDFILESIINETILYYSPEIRNVISDIYSEYINKDQKISDMAYFIYNKEKEDIDADITLVDKSTKVGYLTHSRLNQIKKITDGDFDPETKVSKDFIDSLWRSDFIGTGKGYFTNKQRGEIKISKLINKLLEKEDRFTEADKERFVNIIKSKLSEEVNFKVVSGEDIANYYNSSNYAKETGTLGNSCMRRKSSSVFKIYIENPEKCSLLVMLDDDGKVLGRSILWNLDSCELDGVTKFMDRIYTANDFDLYKFQKWAKENGYAYKRKNTFTDLEGIIFEEKEYSVSMTINLKKIEYEDFPYLDTFRLYDPSNKILSNENVEENDSEYEGYYILNDTDGGYTLIEGGNYSEWHGRMIPEDESVYSDYLNDWLRRDDSVEVTSGSRNYRGWYPADYDDVAYSDVTDDYYHVNDCVYSEYHDTYLLESESNNVVKKVYTDGDVSNDDCYIHDNLEDKIWIPYRKLNKMLWYKKLTDYWNDWENFVGVLIEDNLLKDYKGEWIVNNFDLETYRVISEEENWLTELDAKILGIKINEEESRLECLFEYFDRTDTNEILVKINTRVKELDNLINNQTVIDFGDGEKEEYLEKLKSEKNNILERKEQIEDMMERYWS